MTAKEMQARSADKRWSGLSAEEKSAEMSRVRKLGIKNRAKKKGGNADAQATGKIRKQ